MADSLGEELTATYQVTITGFQRTKSEMAKLDSVVASLRAGNFRGRGNAGTATINSRRGGNNGIFEAKVDELEGRVQTATGKAMIRAMDFGKEVQAKALEAATTPTGESGKSHGGGRGGPGRNDSGAMIKRLKRNAEVARTPGITIVTGYHGWSDGGTYDDYQEHGTKGRGGGKAAEQRAAGKVYRAPNKARGRVAGQKRSSGAGIPAANSLGTAIVPVREFLKAELNGLKR